MGSASSITPAVQSRKKGSSKTKSDKPVPCPTAPLPRIHPRETELTLTLATALTLILGSSGTDASLRRGCDLLYEYLKAYREVRIASVCQAITDLIHLYAYCGRVQVYGEERMVPNHHWALHTEPQLLDYGTVYEIWAFLAERLNKTLKGANLNNWDGGQLEITMMRTFERTNDAQSLVSRLTWDQELICVFLCVVRAGALCRMRRSARTTGRFSRDCKLLAQGDTRGSRHSRGKYSSAVNWTGPCQWSCEVTRHALSSHTLQVCLLIRRTVPGSRLVAGPEQSPGKKTMLADKLQGSLRDHYNQRSHSTALDSVSHVWHRYDPRAPPHAIRLNPEVTSLKYIELDARRITPHDTAKGTSSSSALVKVDIDGRILYGEVLRLFIHTQTGLAMPGAPEIFAEMVYLVPVADGVCPVPGNPWEA